MKSKGLFVLLMGMLLSGVLFSGCAKEAPTVNAISAEQAKEMMTSNENVMIIDVREQDEYDAGHIPQAVLLPLGQIQSQAEQVIPGKETVLLVYCRTGRRSALAAQQLVSMGYTNVYDFGGILDWPYDVEQ